MKIDKKYIIAGGLAIISIALAGAYLQYKRMMNYAFKVKGIKVLKISTNRISFDLFIDFINKSNITINILEILTKIYVNDKFISNVENKNPMSINGDSTSTLSVNISFDPNDIVKVLGGSYLDLISNPQNVVIKADIKMKAKLSFFTVNIPYVYTNSLKELMAKPTNV